MDSTGSLSARSDERELLAELGLRVPEQVTCGLADAATAAAKIPGSKVVVKVAEPYIAHKTEMGAVRIVDREAVVATVGEMAARLSATGFTLSEYVEHDLGPGSELLLTIRWTPEFGPLVTFGIGGVATEVLSSVAVLAPEITRDIDAAIAPKNFTPLVTGFRNQKAKIEKGALRELLARALEFAARHVPHHFSEIEINPLVPTPQGLYAVDTLWREPASSAARPPRPVEKIGRLLAPRSIAVMGVSRSLNPGRVIVNNLTKAEYAGRIYVIKPGEQSLDGIPCVPDIASLPEPVDLLVLSIAAELVPDAIDEVIASGRAESVIVIPGGLGEYSGSETLELRVKNALGSSRASRSRGPVVNGANCLGIESQPARVNTIFLPEQKLRSGPETEVPLAIVSQSGALAVVLRTRLAPFVPRYIVSIGNQIDLTVADYLEHLSTESDLDVLAFYVEGFAPLDGKRWMELAGELVRRGKSVILYRAGRTAAGARATSSHTAATAGDAVATRELAAQAGVLYAETFEEFADLIRLSLLMRGRRPAGMRLGAMSNAGFETVGMADNLGAFTMAALSEPTRTAIAEVVRESRLEKIVTVTNPLDVNPMLNDTAFARVAERLIADENVDAAVIACVPLSGAVRTLAHELDMEGPTLVKVLTTLWSQTSKPWVSVVDAGPLYDELAGRLHAAGVPVFRSADRAVRTLARWCSVNS